MSHMTVLDGFIAKFSLQVACAILIVLPTFFLIFHALIIAGVLPRNIVWSGRLTDQTFLPFELLALALNLSLMLIGGVVIGFIKSAFTRSITD